MKRQTASTRCVPLLALLAVLVLALCSTGLVFAFEYVEDYRPVKTPGDAQFDFDGNYEPPELAIDGLATDTQWAGMDYLTTFGKGNNAKVKIYRGEKALFFFFDVSDANLLTFGETNDDKVTHSDSIEVYLDTLLDGGIKPQVDDYQINLGIHGKTRIMQGSGSNWGNWNGLIDYEVALSGTLNSDAVPADTGYSIEVMIPYAQIGIEKNDDIGISFGQVDKIGDGDISQTDWDWFGWTYKGSLREPQSPDNYVVLKPDNTLLDRSEVKMPDASIAGYVRDSVTGEPVPGVRVTGGVTGEGETLNALTDAQGYFVFDGNDSDKSYTLSLRKSGYYEVATTYESAELRASKGGVVSKTIPLINQATAPKTTLTGTVSNVVDGPVERATVKVEGTTLQATSDLSGAFTIEGVPALGDISLLVSSERQTYEDTVTVVKKDDMTIDGTTALGDVDLNLRAGGGRTFGGGSGTNLFQFYITRNKTGMFYKLVTATKFDDDEDAQLFVHAGPMTAKPKGILVYGDGSVGRDGRANLFDQFDVATSGIEVTVEPNGEGSILYVTIPYAFMGMRPSDVFAYSFGSHNAGGWDGYGHDGDGHVGFVAPEQASAYMRIDRYNRIYGASNNVRQVQIHGMTTPGATVSYGGKTTTAEDSGAYLMEIPQPETEGEVSFSKIGYTERKATIRSTDFDNADIFELADTILSEKKVTVTGTVTDNAGIAVEGATVTVGELTATTDAEGKFSIAEVGAFTEATVKAVKTGYTQAVTAISLADLNSAAVTFDVSLTLVDASQTMTVTGKVVNLLGTVEGVTVTIEGTETSVTSAADGTFTLADVPLASYNLILSKSGYENAVVGVDATGIENGGTKALGDIEIKLAYGVMGKFAKKNNAFADFTGYVTRGLDAFEFKFVSTRAFTGHIELFIDTKASTEVEKRDATDYRFNLGADGTIAIENWGGPNTVKPDNMTLSVTNVGAVYTVVFTLPYDFFGLKSADNAVASTEVIGISAGQWMGSDWDGWEYAAGGSYDNSYFVKPETTKDYIRLDRNNRLYVSDGNFEYVAAPEGYNLGFGTDVEKKVSAADDFSAKIGRDGTGLTFDFIARGSFTAADTLAGSELVVIYLDLGPLGQTTGGWTMGEEDMIVKVFADGKVYYKLGSHPWWQGAEGATALDPVAITRESGATRFSVTIPYAAMNVAADSTIGFCLREAQERAGLDILLYDPWYDFFVEGHEAKIDAAGQKTYPRIDKDGNVAFAA